VTVHCHLVDALPKVSKGLEVSVHQKIMNKLSLSPPADPFVGFEGAEVDVLLSSVDMNRWRKGEEIQVDDLTCCRPTDWIVTDLNTEYILTRNGWAATGSTLQEIEEGTTAHALSVSTKASQCLNKQLE